MVLRPGDRPGRFTALRYRGDRLTAAECVNAPADFMVVRKALAQGRAVSRDAAADAGVPLKKLVA